MKLSRKQLLFLAMPVALAVAAPALFLRTQSKPVSPAPESIHPELSPGSPAESVFVAKVGRRTIRARPAQGVNFRDTLPEKEILESLAAVSGWIEKPDWDEGDPVEWEETAQGFVITFPVIPCPDIYGSDYVLRVVLDKGTKSIIRVSGGVARVSSSTLAEPPSP